VHEKAKQCGKFWKGLKGKRADTYGDLTLVDMYAHCKMLYEQADANQMPCIGSLPDKPSFFTVGDVNAGLGKLASNKAGDLQGMKVEMLKWMPKDAHAWISEMFNLALQHGMPHDWNTNWIKPLHKGGDANNASNYRTIMVGSLTAKLFGCVMECKISSWVEENDKCALGQAGFQKQHSTIDHLITLRVLMEESRLKGKGFIVALWTSRKLLTRSRERIYGSV